MANKDPNPKALRLKKLRKTLEKRSVDLALVFNQYNVAALTGVFCDNACLVLATNHAPVFITDFRYIPMVRRVAPWIELFELPSGKKFTEVILTICENRKIKPICIGLEEKYITASRWLNIAEAFLDSDFEDISDDLATSRFVKLPEEIKGVRRAAKHNDAIWCSCAECFAANKEKMTEKDLSCLILSMMPLSDGREAFDTIVCSGATAAECHHLPDETPWCHGKDPLLVDMGVKINGYCSDMTRCILPQKPSKKYLKVYNTVLKANRAAVAAARPGITCGELDAVARRIIAKAGYGKYFGHALGHGVGLEVHEGPTVRAKAKTALEPGMIITIEPGVYIEGELGVRIEDLVLITKTGCEVLSSSPR